MHGADRDRLVHLLGIESKTKGGLEAGAEDLLVAERNHTRVVDLGLEGRARGAVEDGLSTDLESNTANGELGVVDGLGTGLDVAVHTVVVAGSVGLKAVQSLDGDCVVGGVVANSGSVFCDLSVVDIVRGLGTGEESVAANDTVSSDDALRKDEYGSGRAAGTRTLKRSNAPRVWKPDCLKAALKTADLEPLSGWRVLVASILRPLAKVLSSSTVDLSTFEVVHAWV